MLSLEREPGVPGCGRNGVKYLLVASVAGVFVGMQLWQDLVRVQHQEEQIQIASAKLDSLHGKVSKERREAQQERQKLLMKGDGRALTALDVLAGLEADWQDDISFLRIDSDIGKRHIRMQVLAKSREDLFQFVERLKSRFGDEVFLERHSLTPAPRDGWLVSANLAVGWK